MSEPRTLRMHWSSRKFNLATFPRQGKAAEARFRRSFHSLSCSQLN